MHWGRNLGTPPTIHLRGTSRWFDSGKPDVCRTVSTTSRTTLDPARAHSGNRQWLLLAGTQTLYKCCSSGSQKENAASIPDLCRGHPSATFSHCLSSNVSSSAETSRPLPLAISSSSVQSIPVPDCVPVSNLTALGSAGTVRPAGSIIIWTDNGHYFFEPKKL